MYVWGSYYARKKLISISEVYGNIYFKWTVNLASTLQMKNSAVVLSANVKINRDVVSVKEMSHLYLHIDVKVA